MKIFVEGKHPQKINFEYVKYIEHISKTGISRGTCSALIKKAQARNDDNEGRHFEN